MSRLALRCRTEICSSLAAAVLAFGLIGPVHAGERTDLDQGWQFRVDPDEFGESFGWMRTTPADTEAVTLPHTWNIGPRHDYLGVAWYFRPLELPPLDADSHVVLHFGATFYKARIWLNGTEIAQHEGGYTAYEIEITPYLRAANLLAVRIDNRPDATSIPGFGARGSPQAWYDWWTYGGIVRDVWLTRTGPAWIARQAIRTEQYGDTALVRDQVALHSALPDGAAARLQLTAYDAQNLAVATHTQAVVLKAGDATAAVTLELRHAKLWSLSHPDLYRLVTELRAVDRRVLDKHEDNFGVRTIEIRDRHLLINGERVRLTGLTRHEDSPDEGLAETPATMQHDLDDLKALHVTLTRPVHYPQNPYVLDYADRHGMLLVPEIPIWQFSEAQLADPKVRALAQQQMSEMIGEAGNHPSIFAWSVANESAMASSAGREYFHQMRQLIRSLDPQRLVSFADDNLPKLSDAAQSPASEADFLMMNQYFGSWAGPESGLEPALDRVNQLFPDKMLIVSEFGYPGIFAKDATLADEARVRTIQAQLPVLAARDWIAGAMLWCYQDYRSHRNLWPGQIEGFVDHGVVDEQRVHKPSFAAWQVLNAPVGIEGHWNGRAGQSPSGFRLVLTPHSIQELPFYPLHDFVVHWRLENAEHELLASGQRQLETSRPTMISEQVPDKPGARVEQLRVTVLDPSGSVAADFTLPWNATGGDSAR
jgi:beta-glucuronidase